MKSFFKKSTCSPHIKKSKTCFSKDSLLKIAKELQNKKIISKKIKLDKKKENELWKLIREKMSSRCNNDETCWVEQDLVKSIKDPIINNYTFRPKMPNEWKSDKYAWLSTLDINKVMIQAEKIHNDFVFFGPVPSDCPKKIYCELSGLDPIKLQKKGIKKIGIIYNLDISTGDGTHWTAIYIDIPKKEVDYFDSYGDKPTYLINQFIEKIGKKFIKSGYEPKLIYNDKRKQYGHSECGMYSMYFILRRLIGDSMYKISQQKITDKKMNDLRKIFYR